MSDYLIQLINELKDAKKREAYLKACEALKNV